ncbi:MAG TPA: hypothetical protein VMQ44_03985 [Candidatus Saccharimonadales bacterium]|nr:hypothetical protein [Candidatus Saccharimonadales bacterium]
MFSTKIDLINSKLKSLSADFLRELASNNNINSRGNKSEVIVRLLPLPSNIIDEFIKSKYTERVEERRRLISDDELISELEKIDSVVWGAVQGQLDQLIQRDFVRKYYRYNDIIQQIDGDLAAKVRGYVLASWYNHWTTVLIEDHISLHKNVVPTTSNNFGIDIFFDGQPFDLKITYLPRNYSLVEAEKHSTELIKWLYENQGAQRFGADNRLYVVLASKEDLAESWKLKRDFNFIYERLDGFFDSEKVTSDDELVFTFDHTTHTTVSKIVLITK